MVIAVRVQLRGVVLVCLNAREREGCVWTAAAEVGRQRSGKFRSVPHLRADSGLKLTSTLETSSSSRIRTLLPFASTGEHMYMVLVLPAEHELDARLGVCTRAGDWFAASAARGMSASASMLFVHYNFTCSLSVAET